VQQAYERGLQEGCNSPLVEGMIATHLQPVSVEMPPQNAVETETAYAHGFQDGKAAEKLCTTLLSKPCWTVTQEI